MFAEPETSLTHDPLSRARLMSQLVERMHSTFVSATIYRVHVQRICYYYFRQNSLSLYTTRRSRRLVKLDPFSTSLALRSHPPQPHIRPSSRQPHHSLSCCLIVSIPIRGIVNGRRTAPRRVLTMGASGPESVIVTRLMALSHVRAEGVENGE